MARAGAAGTAPVALAFDVAFDGAAAPGCGEAACEVLVSAVEVPEGAAPLDGGVERLEEAMLALFGVSQCLS